IGEVTHGRIAVAEGASDSGVARHAAEKSQRQHTGPARGGVARLDQPGQSPLGVPRRGLLLEAFDVMIAKDLLVVHDEERPIVRLTHTWDSHARSYGGGTGEGRGGGCGEDRGEQTGQRRTGWRGAMSWSGVRSYVRPIGAGRE